MENHLNLGQHISQQFNEELEEIRNKVLEMGDGDAAIGTVRAFEAGVMDIPWSPNRHCKSRVLPARDVDGRWTVDAWAPLEGRVINGGFRVRLGQ